MTAGHASRMELYGSLLLVVIVVSLMCERMAIDRVLINTLIKDQSKPAIIQEQHNNMQVTVEDPRTALIKEIAEQQGWKKPNDENK